MGTMTREAIRDRLALAATAAGIDPAEIQELIDREAARRAAAAIPPYTQAIDDLAAATQSRDAAYKAWQRAVATASHQGAPRRLVAEAAGVSRSRVTQLVRESIAS